MKSIRYILVAIAFLVSITLKAQLQIFDQNPVTIDFETFDGWNLSGEWTTNGTLGFWGPGDPQIDTGRGIYSYSIIANTTLGVLLKSSDYVEFILQIQNKTGSPVTSITFNSDLYDYSYLCCLNTVDVSAGYSDVQFANSNAGTIQTSGSGSQIWNLLGNLGATIDLSGAPLANNASYFLSWTVNNPIGSSDFDRIAIDNIQINVTTSGGPVNETVINLVTPVFGPAIDPSDPIMKDYLIFEFMDMGADGQNTDISDLSFSQGPGNTILDWTEFIMSAEIRDWNGNFWPGIVSPDRIDFIGIPQNEFKLNNGAIKNLTLSIRLKAPFGGTLPSTIDNLIFEVQLNGSDITVYPGSSGFDPASTQMFPFNIDVNATMVVFAQPPTDALVGIDMTPEPIVYATDLFFNIDLDFNDIPNSITNILGLQMTLPPVPFIDGVLTLVPLQFQEAGYGTDLNVNTNIGTAQSNLFNVTAEVAVSPYPVATATPLLNNATDVALLGFSLSTMGSLVTLESMSFITANDPPAGRITNIRIVSSANVIFDGIVTDPPIPGLAVNDAVNPFTIDGFVLPIDNSETYFFLVADVDNSTCATTSSLEFLNSTFSYSSGPTTLLTGGIASNIYSFQDANPAQVNSITPGITPLITEADIPGNFTVTVVYSEPMNTSINPGINFTPDPATTLVFSGGSWPNGTTYLATYNISDENVNIQDINISVTNAQEAVGSCPANDGQLINAFSIDTTNPIVINVTSLMPDEMYTELEVIDINVIYDRVVFVSGGTPTLSLNSDVSASASFFSGSGSTTLTFLYTVQYPESSADLDYASNTPISLNGAVIDDGFATAIPTFPSPGTTNSLGSNKNLVIILKNRIPQIDAITNPVPISEDGGLQTINLTGITDGDVGAVQSITVTSTSNNTAVIPDPTVGQTGGSLTYTPVLNMFGGATITVTVKDNGGTLLGGVNEVQTTFDVVVNSANDPPSFNIGATSSSQEDDALVTISNFATGISPGPPDEVAQTVAFGVNVGVVTGSLIFNQDPAIDPSGTLTYLAAPNTSGTADVLVTLSDNGPSGGINVNTSAIQNFTIIVSAVNDPPFFTSGTDVVVNEDAGLSTISGWATNISEGQPDESAQVLTFNISQSGGPITFAQAPSVNPSTGNLTFQINADVNGSGSFNISLQDNGSSTPPNQNLSGTSSFNIQVNPVNDAPTIGSNSFSIDENSPNSTLTGTITFGDIDGSDNLTLSITNGNTNSAFSIDNTGAITVNNQTELNFEVTPSFTLTVQVQDDGIGNLTGTALVDISLNDINDPPTNIDVSPGKLQENNALFDPAGILVADDEDGDAVTFELPAGVLDNDKFRINNDALEALDFFTIADNPLQVSIRATDINGASSDQTVIIEIVGQGTPIEPSNILISSSSIDERLPTGSAVGTLSSADANLPDDSHSYSLVAGTGDTDNLSFQLSGTANEILESAEVFNFVTKNSYTIRVRSTDASGLFLEKPITITINDIVLPDLSLSGASVSPTTQNADKDVTFSVNADNQTATGVDASITDVKAYISSNATYNSSNPGTDLGFTANLPAYPGNSSTTYSAVITLPAALGSGAYTVFFVIDPSNAVDEDEDPNDPAPENNNFIAVPITILDEDVPPEITNTSFINTFPAGGAAITLSVTATDNNAVDKVVFTYRGLAEEEGGNVSMELTSTTDDFSVQVDELMLDIMGLYFEFTAFDLAGNASQSVKNQIYLQWGIDQDPVLLPELKGGGAVANYEIISIPFQLADNRISSILAVLPDQDDTKWRLLQHKKDGTCCLEYPEDLTFFEIGQSYWINVVDPIPIRIFERKIESIGPNNPKTINLEFGWNQIGNPYLISVAWNDIIAFNNDPAELGQLRVFSGTGFKNGNRLNPFEGGFVRWEGSSPFQLKIPLPSSTDPPESSIQQVARMTIDQNEWEVLLEVRSGEISNAYSSFGMHPEAKPGIDRFDEITSPRFFEYLELNFQHPEYPAPKFSNDIVPTSRYHFWDFKVESNLGDYVSINWDNRVFGDNEMELILVDRTEMKVINMREVNTYKFYGEERSLRIHYGTGAEIESNLIPEQVLLGKNYPNPFTNETIIPFTLPAGDAYQVFISVYDLYGKKVKEIVNSYYESGFYQVVWDGKDEESNKLSSGIYVYQLRTRSNKESRLIYKKMLIY